jgi:hypothetical protein
MRRVLLDLVVVVTLSLPMIAQDKEQDRIALDTWLEHVEKVR